MDKQSIPVIWDSGMSVHRHYVLRHWSRHVDQTDINIQGHLSFLRNSNCLLEPLKAFLRTWKQLCSAVQYQKYLFLPEWICDNAVEMITIKYTLVPSKLCPNIVLGRMDNYRKVQFSWRTSKKFHLAVAWYYSVIFITWPRVRAWLGQGIFTCFLLVFGLCP